MTIRQTVLAAFLFGLAMPASAQDQRVDTRQSAAWFEFLGNGGLYSLNAETYVSESVIVRAGFARWNSADFLLFSADRFVTIPLTTSFVYGSGHSKLETGLGLMFGRRSTGSGGDTLVDATGIFGYRYEPAGHRVIYRLVATPFYPLQGDYPHDAFFFSIGMSVGFQF